MLLSNYDYKVKFCRGITNANADGLSRVNHAVSEDDSAWSVFMVCTTPAFPDLPVCLDVLACSAHSVASAETAHVEALGPRQALLESSACRSCHQKLRVNDPAGIVCDGGNGVYHFGCVGLSKAPVTYWYCPTCCRQLQTTGIHEPAKDVVFQRYLLTGRAPSAALATYFQ